ncbi:tyrosine kinase receptor Cad96Ca-like [Ptychodera flava]|uniref:tyrosine kinase receptor Cad96Ca-like n=1 Tax=Ptychodera flava TaxID=63121 RepID=UPI00396A9455
MVALFMIFPSTPSSSSSGGSPVAIALPCGIVFVVVSVVALGIVLKRRRRRTKTVKREKSDSGNKFEGDGNAYQEIEFEQVQEPNAYSSIEPNPVPERPNSYGDFEYEMPIEVLLEFPKENVHHKSIIGEGTFGKVARAEAWKLAGKEGPTIVALKTLKDNATGEDKKSLLDEFELLKHIGRHKHILSLVGCCTKTDEIYMLFEYMELGNLQDYLRKSRNCIATEYLEAGETSPILTSGDLIIFAGQVASGMEYLSSKEGFPTYTWMAPEAIQASEFSTKSDVWSFGIVMWEIVTIGHTPYPRMSDNEVKAYLKQGGRMNKPAYCDGDL